MRVSSKLIVFNGTQLLLLKKKTSKTKFSLLGGGVKKSESPLEAVLREANEEGDVNLQESDLKLLKATIDLENINGLVIYYYVTNSVKNFKLLEPHKFESLGWVDYNYALAKMKKKDRVIIENYIKNWKRK